MPAGAVRPPSTGHRPLLQGEGLSVGLGGTSVLEQLDVRLDEGELLAVRGPSGSGKSTLLHVLAGLIRPEQGSVLLHGQRIDRLPDRRRCAVRLRSFGFVFQGGDLLPELTVAENVGLPLRFLGAGRAQVRSQVQQALAQVGIGELGDRHLSEVSGGQLQRAAIARALIHDPAVVFADEPTGSLDDRSAEQVLRVLVDQARRRGAGVLLVTHSRSVAAICDRVVVLDGGTLAPQVLAPSGA